MKCAYCDQDAVTVLHKLVCLRHYARILGKPLADAARELGISDIDIRADTATDDKQES